MGLPWVTSRYGRGGQFASAPAGGAPAAPQVTRQSDLAQWWKLEGLTSETGGPSLIAQNGATTSEGAGVNGETVLLSDGTDDYWNTIDADVGVTTAYSVCFWIKSLEASTTHYAGDFQSFFGWGDTTANYGLVFGPHPTITDGYMYAYASLAGTSDYIYTRELDTNAEHGIDPTDWNMWTQTWASGNSPKLYGNDILMEDPGTVRSGTLDYNTAALGSKFELGRRLGGSGTATSNALWQQLRIYNVELSATDIADIYNSGNGDWA